MQKRLFIIFFHFHIFSILLAQRFFFLADNLYFSAFLFFRFFSSVQAMTRTAPKYSVRWYSQVSRTNNRLGPPTPAPNAVSSASPSAKLIVHTLHDFTFSTIDSCNNKIHYFNENFKQNNNYNYHNNNLKEFMKLIVNHFIISEKIYFSFVILWIYKYIFTKIYL